MRSRRFPSSYSPPSIDSPRAIAGATMFLTNARSLDNTSPEHLARQYALSMKRAEYMLGVERGRRERRDA
jgi:hypothetical protein